ncbi:hypothetical protein D5R81_09480 [Parashewanella spongiae]|uniref:Uncharacterized protein n=1 Tax=Parashewanella spongiae TaxID=342950 RepID=A0A3A6UCC0_9GAMM|nr:hypothetical protein [Parashewanella spongiae]MCL1078122.1 hypothetical protein [Parashewanella spongiae]RJY16369.1 hypothetical protein D5R81_09480 [Parashewanella spongiae]
MNTQKVISIAMLSVLGVAVNSALAEVNNWFTLAMFAAEWSEQLSPASSSDNVSMIKRLTESLSKFYFSL